MIIAGPKEQDVTCYGGADCVQALNADAWVGGTSDKVAAVPYSPTPQPTTPEREWWRKKDCFRDHFVAQECRSLL